MRAQLMETCQLKYLALLTQAELSLRHTSRFPVAEFFKILYDNIFKLLEETYICKIKNEKVNSICLWNLTPASFWILS